MQHALRAFTPRDAKALKAAVTTYPNTDDYDLEEALTQLGTGEAMITILSERGAPTPVVWTMLRPPQSSMAAMATEAVDTAAKADALWPKYATEINRESAREKLAARMAQASVPAAPTPPAPGDINVTVPPPPPAPPRQPRGSGKKDDSPVVDYLKSREGRSMMNTVARGIFGLLKRR